MSNCLQENINKREDLVLSVINHLLKKQEQKRYNHVEKLYIFPQGKAHHIFNKRRGHSYKPFFIFPNTRGPMLLTKLSSYSALHIPLDYVKTSVLVHPAPQAPSQLVWWGLLGGMTQDLKCCCPHPKALPRPTKAELFHATFT